MSTHPSDERATDTVDRQFRPFAEKMRAENLPEIAIRTFRYYYGKLLAGDTGHISGAQARPVDDLPDASQLSNYQGQGEDALNRLAVIKLNGGLGTSMGLTGPKSLIEIKNGESFLDVVAKQILHRRRSHGTHIPLVLMDSFNTRTASLAALAEYPALGGDVPLDFVQHKVPKIWQSDLSPATWPEDPDKEWCPPGHGDIYPALLSSGMLAQLLDAGYEYAFVSNIDNLGATVDVRILGYFAAEDLPFLMEVTRRTPADRKGGHLAQNPDGGLLLREIAQCPPDEVDEFQDIDRYRFFNTNNLWIHLPSLNRVMAEQDGLLALPMIRNQKPVDPTQPESPPVYQLETAMGLAISAFKDSRAIQVTRQRFRPVKKTTDLLALWSDAYYLTDDHRIELVPSRTQEPLVELDERFYKLLHDLTQRFPHGAPSLNACERLRVEGDVYFGEDVVVRGDVTIAHQREEPLTIEDGTVLEG